MSGPPPKAAPSVLGLPPVPFKKLYTFATLNDKICVVVGCACACASGAILPLFSLVFGAALNILNDDVSQIAASVSRLALYFLLIAIGASALTFAEISLVGLSTERMMRRLRTAYCKNLLRLDTGWYDTHRAPEAVSRLAEATVTVGTGLDKVATMMRYVATLVCGIAIGFSTSWKLTLVIMACAPLFAIALATLIVIAVSSEKAERTAYARAGDAASEAFSLVRAVAAYGGEVAETLRYSAFAQDAQRAGIRKGLGIGTAVGFMLMTFYAMYGISTYAGAIFIVESRAANSACRYNPTTAGCFSGGTVVTTFVAVLLGALSFGQIGPLMGQISAARAAASDLFGVIDAVPTVDIADDSADLYRGSSTAALSVEFKNVTFAYPSRPDTVVVRNFSVAIPAGSVLGVAGASGSGKSTLALLVARFYDVSDGAVLVDNVDVRKWHLPSLRAALGFVSQEPALFGASLRENIALGVPEGSPAPTDDALFTAARSANAHDFISSLPRGYDTVAGAGLASSALSGGQRQRVCIARALIRQPRLLVLDEATSALDSTSERVVQAAIDRVTAARKMTVLAVAHRLSTLRNADRIIVMESGTIVEDGTHATLSAKPNGVFASMVASQKLAASELDELVEVPLTPSAGCDTVASKAAAGGAVTASAAPERKATVAPAAPPLSLRARLWKLQGQDWPILLIGVFGSCVSGCLQPVVAIVYGGIITLFFNPSDDTIRRVALEYLGYFFLLAGCCFVGVFSRVSVFTYLGERLTFSLRVASFSAALRQSGGWFDRAENSVGRLSTRLSTDAALVKGASGEALGSIVEGFAAVVAALGIAFNASWRLALVLLVAFPLLALGGVFEFRSVAQVNKGGNKALEDAGDVLSELIAGSRTVAAFGLQPRTLRVFSDALKSPYDAGVTRVLTSAGGGAFQRFMLLATYSLAFYAGSQFITQGTLQFGGLIQTFLAITLAAEAIGRITSQAPDTAKAAAAADAIFALIDSGVASAIDPLSETGAAAPAEAEGGLSIEFRNATFAYPTRPDAPVLRNLSLTISPGEFVGIAGPSGCGKSTLALLALRLYDVDSGAVLVGGVDVRDWNLRALRASLGIVQQEPALFADSIAYKCVRVFTQRGVRREELTAPPPPPPPFLPPI